MSILRRLDFPGSDWDGTPCVTLGDGFIEPLGIQNSNVTTHHWSQKFCDFTLTNRSRRRLNLHFPKDSCLSFLSKVARSLVKAGPPEVKRCQAVWNTPNLVETSNFRLFSKSKNSKNKKIPIPTFKPKLVPVLAGALSDALPSRSRGKGHSRRPASAASRDAFPFQVVVGFL